MAEPRLDELLTALRAAIVEEQRAWDALEAAQAAHRAAREVHAKANAAFRELEHDFLSRVRKEAGVPALDALRAFGPPSAYVKSV